MNENFGKKYFTGAPQDGGVVTPVILEGGVRILGEPPLILRSASLKKL